MNKISYQKSLRTIFFITAVFLYFTNSISAQPIIEEKNALTITARAFDNSIKLRWAPTSFNAWKTANKSGYILERFTIKKNNEILPLEQRIKGKKLSASPLKPLSTEAEWKPLMETNDYAAIAAQALYGKSFSVTGNGMNLKTRKDDRQNRFSFGLFAADQSVEVAEALALYFEDTNVEKGAYYLYKIYPAINSSKMPIDTGYIYLGADEIYTLPKPIEVKADFENQVAYLSWETLISNRFYSSYTVERSTNGKDFEDINALPYVGMDKNPGEEGRMLMMDSLPKNDQLYVYRVKGKTIFGETGPASDPVQGIGLNKKVTAPYIESISNQNNTSLGIAWNFDKAIETEITGFKLSRSTTNDGVFEVISGSDPIDKTLRYYIDESPLPVNYYKILAVDKYGRDVNSFAAVAQLDDNTPPAPPIKLRGTILETGEMLMTWASNTEEDLAGYRVYMANRKDRAEYVQITSRPIKENFFSYLVPMNTLSEEVFFKVRALDYRQNKSEFSEIATVTRPDSIPPAAPVFVSARPTTKTVNLIWENSASADVVALALERKQQKDTLWTAIKTFSYPNDMEVKNHSDESAKRGQLYEYRLKATDDADLITYSRIITASKIDKGIRLPIEKINSEVDRKQKAITLQWEYAPDGNNLTHYIIYRSSNNERPRKYASIKIAQAMRAENIWQYQDKGIKMDTDYKYQIRAVYTKGAQSPLSKVISINY